MAIPAGTRLGKYEIVAPLGAGGMGEVYRARDPRLGRDVALKILPAGQPADAGGQGPTSSTSGDERLARFEREARTLARLHHPNIVTIYDVEDANGVRFLAMELVEGRTLASVIPAGGMTLRQVVAIATQVADALAAAHEQGIVHRDLKPGNVMVADDGRVKVLDFGLAKLNPKLSEEGAARADAATVTQDGTVLGTLPYMAPEVLRGGSADARSDLFSLGILLHEMATGQRPFQGESGIAVAAAILQQDAPTVGQVKPDWPPRFGRIVSRCLEKDPRQRTQSALDVSRELQDLVDEPPSRPVQAAEVIGADSPVASRRSDIRAPRRTRWWPLGLAALGVLLTVAAAWLWRGAIVRSPATTGSPVEIGSIAVLPFANLMNDPAQDYFVDGMHEALITELAKLGTVRVTSRSSVLRYKNSPAPIKEVAQELGVDALVEGSVLRAGDRVRITAQLIRGDTDEHVWAQSYDRDLRNVLPLLDEVSGAIAREIGLSVLPVADPPTGKSAATRVDPEAYEAYLKARESTRVMKNPRDFLTVAIPHLERAVELDRDFPQAWATLAAARVYAAFFGLSPAADELPKARAAAERALAMDRTLGEAWAALGTIALYFDWNIAEAGDLLERAVQLTPHDANVRHAYADYLMMIGRADAGLEQVRIGERDNPDYFAIKAVVGFHSVFARRYADAERVFRALLSQDHAEFRGLQSALAEVLWIQGRTDEALKEYSQVWGEGSESARAFEAGLRRGGPRAAMKAAADVRAAEAQAGAGSAVDVAALYAMAGESDLAFRWLDTAFASRRPTLLHAAVHPYFDPIRDDPRFAALLRRVGLPLIDPRHPADPGSS